LQQPVDAQAQHNQAARKGKVSELHFK